MTSVLNAWNPRRVRPFSAADETLDHAVFMALRLDNMLVIEHNRHVSARGARAVHRIGGKREQECSRRLCVFQHYTPIPLRPTARVPSAVSKLNPRAIWHHRLDAESSANPLDKL